MDSNGYRDTDRDSDRNEIRIEPETEDEVPGRYRIEFEMSEVNELSEKQKETILRTLIDSSTSGYRPRRSRYRRTGRKATDNREEKEQEQNSDSEPDNSNREQQVISGMDNRTLVAAGLLTGLITGVVLTLLLTNPCVY